MTTVRQRGEKIRRFIISNVQSHSSDIATVTAEKFGITRQAVHRHLRRLVDERVLTSTGNTRNLKYKLCPLESWDERLLLKENQEEDVVWRNIVRSKIGDLPDNAVDIWLYGFTEMFNNVIDHSNATHAHVRIRRTAAAIDMVIGDDGVGIFKKIQRALGLTDERHALLELAKGKLTTDPQNHSGEGIFFSSRMFDEFAILSGNTCFQHEYSDDDDWIIQAGKVTGGTWVYMKLNNHTSRTTKKVFDKYSSKDHYGFNRTVVPVRMAQFGDDKLVSRSQARRMLDRLDRFGVVIFDFTRVRDIGQAFADEVFRVFANEHPEIELHQAHANAAVKRMISRARQQ